MADFTFLVDVTVTMTALVLPIVLIVRLLVADDDFTVGDLFILPIVPIGEALPPEEETPPRWRPELIRARHGASAPVVPAVSSQEVFRPLSGSEADHARPS